MLLALDVGNTNITLGAFEGPRLAREWRLETGRAPTQLGRKLLSLVRAGRLKADAVVYGSVVPAINRVLEQAVREACGVRPLAVTPRSPLGLRLKVRRPLEVGADRILNALAAFELSRGPAVVLDFGTATTFDCVSREGDYLGGAILPGPRMAALALAEGTAQLPLVEIRRPRRAIGRDSVECLQSGLYFGYLGMVEKMLALTLRELREMGAPRARVLATGGLAGLFARDMPGIPLVRDLTLQGLRIAYERLRGLAAGAAVLSR